MQPDLLTIEGPQRIPEVEKELDELQLNAPTRLLIPVTLQQWWFGGEAALIQLLISWGRRSKNATLVTHIKVEDEHATSQLERLIGRPFGFVAVCMAHDILDRAQQRSFRLSANNIANDQILRMWRGTRPTNEFQPSLWGEQDEVQGEALHFPPVGSRVFLASIDHHPKWRIPQCYFPTGKLRHRDDFIALARAIVKWGNSRFGTSSITTEMYDPVGAILHELFKNTHDWARTDENDIPHLRSARGILVQWHSWREQEATAAVQESPALGAYLNQPALREGVNRYRFLEISVFDSGIGLARHWLSTKSAQPIDLRNIDIQREYHACWECFQKWNSSSPLPHKGLGLHEVLTTLSRLRAFFRVRTGRLSLYRDFVALPYSTPTLVSDGQFIDWSTQSGTLTNHAQVEGVLYTMLVPFLG